MKHHLRKKTFWIVVAIDILLLTAAHLAAYYIRFDGHLEPIRLANIRSVLPLLLPMKIMVFYFFDLYRGMWRYTSLTDLLNILKACIIVSLIAVVAMLMINRFEGFSRSVFLIDGLLTFLFIAGSRVGLRLFYVKAKDLPFVPESGPSEASRKKLLIVGAGDAAEKIIREIRDNRTLPYLVIGFLDDNPSKIGQRIHGVQVLGTISDMHELVAINKPDEILIAIPSAPRDKMGHIVELCRTSGVAFKTLPGLGELIDDQVSIRSMRDVSYKDLLGRPPVRLEIDLIGQVLTGKVVVVTGAGGSIGSELCRQIIRFEPKLLIFVDASEHNLYQIEMEILHERGFNDYLTVLGQVQDQVLLDDIFSKYQPHAVFHAAAYKHVPMIEQNPWEAVTNNIMATKSLIETSIKHQVERFILVSTDKAVRPTNVMGASKRITEKLMQAYCSLEGASSTRFMAVRFGNVIGSSGSVIPLFKRQIELGGPVTVTDPEMTRYFMSIEEASQLILQAATMGEGGEIFILEMGTPVNISQMARELIRLCGREPDTEIEVKYIGLRPGEKLYEELITEGEGIISTDHEKIMVLRGDASDLQLLLKALPHLEELAVKHNAKGIKETLAELIPEYNPCETEAIL